MPPAFVNEPATNKSPLDIDSARTSSFSPAPSAVQLFPSHLATLFAAFPPASVKYPPAYRSLSGIASVATPATQEGQGPFTPEPSAAQLPPCHFAMPLAGFPPAVEKKPPAYRSLPDRA